MSQDAQQPARNYNLKDQKALDAFLQRLNAGGLFTVDSPDYVETDFKKLQAGSVYYLDRPETIESRVQSLENWQKKEDHSLEQEVTLCFVQQASPKFGELVIKDELRKVRPVSGTRVLQEWDGVVVTQGSMVFLVETKHYVRYDDIRKAQQKKMELDRDLANGTIAGWQNFRETALVIGGVDFPEDMRQLCKDEGIMVVTPSGGQFSLEWKFLQTTPWAFRR
jgi:hypothetical protein